MADQSTPKRLTVREALREGIYCLVATVVIVGTLDAALAWSHVPTLTLREWYAYGAMAPIAWIVRVIPRAFAYRLGR